MRQLAYTRPGLGLLEREEPAIVSPTGVKIRIAFASLCGTDLHIVRGDFDRLFGDSPEVLLGHEASGVVEELGPSATAKGLSIGDRVTFYFNRYCGSCVECRSGREQFCTSVEATQSFMSDVVVLEEQQVFRLPDDLTLAEAALVEPVSVALRGVDLCRIEPGATVAVFGGGGIGQIVASLASRSGASRVVMLEPVEEKRRLALRRGATSAIDPTLPDAEAHAIEVTGGRGFDVVIEASGAPAACAAAMRIAARGATVEFLATYRPDYVFELPMADAFLREITLITGVYQSPYAFPRSIALAPMLELDELISVFAPEEAEAAFDAQRTGEAVKAVFDFTKKEGSV
jgi:threonine dehydrogenase-like Zn-dependent dehydrogenase